jgi:hypothetical protein
LKNYFLRASLISSNNFISAGVSAGSSSSFFCILDIDLTIRKITKPRIINAIKSVITNQYLIAGAQASSRTFNEAYSFPSRAINNSLKSTFHIASPIGGITTFAINDLTNVAKAAPKINHTAISIAFPLTKNFLKSCNIFFYYLINNVV